MASITIKTNFSPPVTFDPFAKREIKDAGGSALAVLQPSIDAELPLVGPVHYAPYGEPTGYGTVFVAVVVALALFGAYSIIRKVL